MLETVLSVGGCVVSVLRPVLNSVWPFVGWGDSLTRPVLEFISSFGGWFVGGRGGGGGGGGNLSYTSRVAPRVASRPSICLGLVGSFSYTPSDGIFLVVRRFGSFSKTPRSRNCRSFVGWGVSLTRPMLKSVCSIVG